MRGQKSPLLESSDGGVTWGQRGEKVKAAESAVKMGASNGSFTGISCPLSLLPLLTLQSLVAAVLLSESLT